MPSNILTTDTSFPQLTEEQSTDEKFGVITNYLYMLLEQLRYSMANLGGRTSTTRSSTASPTSSRSRSTSSWRAWRARWPACS